MVNYLDLINKNKPIIVQIGAHDGVLGEEYGLQTLLDQLDDFKLILVEPITEFYEKLPDTYKKYGDKVIYCNFAITEFNGEFNMVLDSGMSKIVDNGGDIKVTGVSWNYFLDSLSIKNIDLLLMDCEGYEFNILKQINYESTLIPIIRFEDYWIVDKSECYSFLQKNGYIIDYCIHDKIYNKVAYK